MKTQGLGGQGTGPALHGAAEAACLVPEGSAILALHLLGEEREEGSESA